MSVAKKLSKQILDQNLLKSFFPLNRLSAPDLHEIEENSTIKQLTRGQLLFEKGSNDEFAYFLLLGEIELLAESASTVIKSGTTQAKFPISDARPRQSTAMAKTNTSVLCVNTNLLDLLLNHDQNSTYRVSDIQKDENNDWLTVFLQSLASMKIPAKNIQALIQHMEEIEVKAGETIIRQSESDDHYYIIKEGRCAITRKASEQYTEVRLAELSQGSGFGEEALITNGTRTATVTMINDGRLMRLNKADFLDLLVEPLMNFVNYQDGLAMVEKGAVLLDVRTMTEHTKDGLKNSINIPLPVLRLKIKELDQRKNYIVFL
jgi:CRP-like cAMP-binding protein